MIKLNRANSRIQFDMKLIDKTCAPDKRDALELIKVCKNISIICIHTTANK